MVVRAGEIYGLLGPNGAGKSTTIGMLTTRVMPTGGQAEVGGVDVIARPAVAKQVIGVVPQTNTLDRAMTVRDNLVFHGRYFGMSGREAKQAAAEMLERVRLADRATMPVLALSGGMAQRLMVARAILHRPQVLFLDEPTAGLDPQSRLALWDILEELHADGQTILLTTHHMDEADQLCDRVAIMDHGRLLALDTPTALKRSTGAASIVRVTADGDLHRLAGALRAEVDGVEDAQVLDGQLRLRASRTTGLLPRIVSASERAGVVVSDLSIAEPTLETVFIDLTGRDLRE
ncbi:MAG: ATP-binding cassette domain-containing protein [Actinobacteria bacterium]|nr:ATP-binding cassette domain-containing protein [Actinomycetota bacterium]